jgi:hypothetical protein
MSPHIFFNMTLDSSTKLCGPARCVIYCSKSKFDEHPQDLYGEFFVKKVVEYTFGDYQKASLLGVVTGKHAFIIFDYDNPDHLSSCKVLGFKIKQSIRPISVPPKAIHSTVSRWKEENESYGLSFPRQGQVCPNTVYSSANLSGIWLLICVNYKLIPSSKGNPVYRSPFSSTANNSSTAEEDTTKDQHKDSENTWYVKNARLFMLVRVSGCSVKKRGTKLNKGQSCHQYLGVAEGDIYLTGREAKTIIATIVVLLRICMIASSMLSAAGFRELVLGA